MAFNFDGVNKRITIAGEYDVIVKNLYSQWKIWATQDNNLQYQQAFRSFGGDPTIAGQTAPAYYFLTNGWRIIVNEAGMSYTFSYNLYTDEGENPIITVNGATALLNNSDVGIVKTALAKALDYAGIVHVDQLHGESGIDYPAGTAAQPVNNLAEAITIANLYKFHEIYLHGGTYNFTNEMIDDFLIYGDSPKAVTLIFDGTSAYNNTRFRHVTLTGNMSNSTVDLERCIADNLLDFNGTMFECAIKNRIRIDPDGEATLVQCYSGHPGAIAPILDMHPNQPTTIAIRAYSGGLNVENCDTSGDIGTIEYIAGKCNLTTSCTDGYLSIRGNVRISDSSNGSTIDKTATVSSLVDLTGVTINLSDVAVDVNAIATTVRNDLDANSTRLANIDAGITEVKTKTDKSLTKVEFLSLSD